MVCAVQLFHAADAQRPKNRRRECLLPFFERRWIRSVTSGSRAQFSSIVSPSASVAAISKFSVPVTVIFSKTMCAPFNRPFPGRLCADYTVVRADLRTHLRPAAATCRSTGQCPIEQPPVTKRAQSRHAPPPPNVRMDARIVLTSSTAPPHHASVVASMV